jgi:MurNAc alpha-1-phosphate uridylyltransferase
MSEGVIRRALILAAGRGERMRPLTDTVPKPLLRVGGKRLIEYHLERLATAGVREVVINTSHLAEQFPAALGDGARWDLDICYSYEGSRPLETGGGMRRALPLLGNGPFIVVSADIFSDYDYTRLTDSRILGADATAHLVMVPNPDFHPRGDFWLDGGRLNNRAAGERLTFANIGVYRAALLEGSSGETFKLLPMYQRAMEAGALSGERFHGPWWNLGTREQLNALDASLRADLRPI